MIPSHNVQEKKHMLAVETIKVIHVQKDALEFVLCEG